MKKKKLLNENIKDILSKILRLRTQEIKDNTGVVNTPNWDSINQIEIIVALEKKYKIKFSQSEISKLDNYSNILKILKKKVG
tara:strand:+ start:135 stop:380 length:246 start_codon:yes stop_codon:yes gene_type:complete